MRLRIFAVPLVALLGAGVAVMPSLGSPAVASTATVSGIESGHEIYAWSPQTVTISSGGQVTFKDPSKKVPHGIVWKSVPETPSCSGVPIDSFATNWTGTCTFTKAGSYQYYCSYHGPAMSGTVVVLAPGEEPPPSTSSSTPTMTMPETGASMQMTMPTTGATGTTGTEPMATSTAPAPATDSLSAGALRLSGRQRAHLRGSLDVALTGSSLQITLLAPRAQLSRALPHPRASEVVGHFDRSGLAAGPLGFEVALDKLARGALKRRGRLSLTVRIVLTPPHGMSVQRSIGLELLR